MLEEFKGVLVLISVVVGLAAQFGGMMFIIGRRDSTLTNLVIRLEESVVRNREYFGKQMQEVKEELKDQSVVLGQLRDRNSDHSGQIRVLDVRVGHVEKTVGGLS